ncbi:MAG: DUF3429 domain-containing protein [Pseudomonadota bacterium]
MPQDRSKAESGGLIARITPGVPAPAAWLGLSGLLPFAALAIASASLSGQIGDLAAAALAGYGAVILSFMGGCRWGFAAAGLGEGSAEDAIAWWRYAVSVLPALYAWPVMLMIDPWRPALLALGFVALLAADIGLTRTGGAPAWWTALRWPLSLGAAGALLLGAVAG